MPTVFAEPSTSIVTPVGSRASLALFVDPLVLRFALYRVRAVGKQPLDLLVIKQPWTVDELVDHPRSTK